MYNENYLGFNGFLWFVGVVENRQDPLYAGRLKVRALGHHTENLELLPTADLPWASVMMSTTSSGISGIGSSPSGLLEGSWVLGYFRDGQRRQEMVILGSLPGRPTELADNRLGFYDPNEIYPKYKDEPDVNRLAVNRKDSEGNEINAHLSLILRRATRITGIPTADFNAMTTAVGDVVLASDGDTFDQPAIPYNALYPYNHVYETESGHLIEYDDTPSAERIHIRHRSGTSTEMSPDGTLTNIIKGDQYTLTSGNNSVYIQGKSDTTIDGRHKLYINKNGQSGNNYDIQIGPGANVNIQVDSGDINLHTLTGRINMNSGGDFNLKVGGDYYLQVDGSAFESINGNHSESTSGAVTIRGATIDLNP
jgi:hypothetical protein